MDKMTVRQIETRIKKIVAEADDPETSHSMRDGLYADVLHAIGGGAQNPIELAQAALKVGEHDLTFWYA